MYVRVIALVGYFYLHSQAPSWPLRKARWGHIAHGNVGTEQQAQDFAHSFRDFILSGSTALCQLDKLVYGTVPTLDTSKNSSDQEWAYHTLYDHNGALYPSVQYSAPYWGKTRGWLDASWHPLPPFMSLRYRRVTSPPIDGRQHYGYCRTIQCRWGLFNGFWAENYAPFAPIAINSAYQWHIAEALTLSGFDAYHNGTNREVVLYFREGVLSVANVTGYEKDIITTTSRNFYIR
jgi:hypothetical protein